MKPALLIRDVPRELRDALKRKAQKQETTMRMLMIHALERAVSTDPQYIRERDGE